MTIDSIRECCLAFPHATENVQWGSDLCFKIGGKLFAVAPLEVAPVRLSLKCSAENFAELCERPGIKPAAYLARAQWVSLERWDALSDSELRDLLANSYQLIFQNLPKKLRAELSGEAPQPRSPFRVNETVLPRDRKPATTRSAQRKATAKGKRGESAKNAGRKSAGDDSAIPSSKKSLRKASKRG